MNKKDFSWSLSLFGTAIGAGVLFLPIAIGLLGIIPSILLLLLIYPIVYFPHRALCRFVISNKDKEADITKVANSYFGLKKGFAFNLLYLFCILPILLIYSVGILNTLIDFLKYQIGINADSRFLLSLVIMVTLILLVSMGRNFIIKLMSLIVIPFILSLLVLSLWMIQYWDFSIISQNLFHSPTVKGVVISIFVTIPIIIFSFNHSPIISSLGIYAKEEYGDKADEKASKIISLASIMMIAVVSLFILSTLFSLTSQDLMNAKEQNISILTYLANHSNNPYLQYMGPLIAIVAMSKSFFGHYLGSKEGIDSLVSKFCVDTSKKTSGCISLLIVFSLCVIVSYFNPNILDVISNLIGPFLIIMLFFIPIYSIYKFKNLSRYKNKYVDSLIVLIGLLTIIIVTYQAIQSIL